jgi:hypothetical protein
VTATEMLKCHQEYTIMQLVKIQIQIGIKMRDEEETNDNTAELLQLQVPATLSFYIS